MVLRSYISIEISARTDATSVRCTSRMWRRQSHLTEANALVLYFCTSIQKDIFDETCILYTHARNARRAQILVYSFFATSVIMQSCQSKMMIQRKSGNILRGPAGQNLDDLSSRFGWYGGYFLFILCLYVDVKARQRGKRCKFYIVRVSIDWIKILILRFTQAFEGGKSYITD